MNRRDLLKGAAAAPLAMLPISSVMAADRSDWNKALAHLRATEAKYNRISTMMDAAHNAAQAACPRREEFFSRYRLGVTDDRAKNLRAAHMSLVIERAKGPRLTDAECDQIVADANRVVDEFEAWCVKHDAAFAEYDKLEQQHDALVDARDEARKAVIATDAPDQQALLFKIELLASMLDELENDDAENLAALRTDARRLLSHGRA